MLQSHLCRLSAARDHFWWQRVLVGEYRERVDRRRAASFWTLKVCCLFASWGLALRWMYCGETDYRKPAANVQHILEACPLAKKSGARLISTLFSSFSVISTLVFCFRRMDSGHALDSGVSELVIYCQLNESCVLVFFLHLA